MITKNNFAPSHPSDRNFFLTLMLLVWAAIISGFTYDLMVYQAARGFQFPSIVHIHALVFVAWLVLFSLQIILIRKNNLQLHKKLGMAAAFLIPLMVILGIMTAIITETVKFGTPDANTPFLSIMLGDMLVFGSLSAAGFYFRKSDSPAHKRLLLLATLAISDAGFGRGFSYIVAPYFGKLYWTCTSYSEGFWPYIGFQLLGPLLLILALGIYDLITRKRLHPVYIVAVLWWLCINLFTGWLYFNLAWLKIATHIVGH